MVLIQSLFVEIVFLFSISYCYTLKISVDIFLASGNLPLLITLLKKARDFTLNKTPRHLQDTHFKLITNTKIVLPEKSRADFPHPFFNCTSITLLRKNTLNRLPEKLLQFLFLKMCLQAIL